MKYSHYTLKTINNNELLKHAFNYTIKNNSSLVAPYHNQSHIMNMCNTITEIYLNDKKISEKEYEILLISALFHDMNHSQGQLSDEENILIAIDALNAFVIQLDVSSKKYNISQSQYDQIVYLIKTTQYPYVVNVKTESQKIIRDADLSQIFNYTSNFGHNVCGLKIELAKTMNWSDFIENNNKFVDHVEFETDYMKNKMIEEKEFLSEYLTILKDLII